MAEVTAAGPVPRREALRGHAAMFLFPALVAGSFTFGGMVSDRIDPVALNAVRFLLAGSLTLALAAGFGQVRRGAWRAPWRHPVLGGLYAIYFVLMFHGLRIAPPVSMAAVFTLTPAMSALIAWGWLGQRPGGRMALALAIGAAGALWVVFRADLSALIAFRVGAGERLFFVGCLAHALYPLLSRRITKGDPPLVVLTGVLLSGAIWMVIVGSPAILATDWAALPLWIWGVIGYLAVFSGAVTFFLIQYAAMRLPGAKVMAYTYLVPAWVAVWEIAVGHGAPPALLLAGVGLTVVALALLLKED